MSRENSKKLESAEYAGFALRLKSVLDDRKIKPVDLTKLLSSVKSDETSYAWLRGDQLPSGKNLLELSQVLKISADWLLTGEQPTVVPESAISTVALDQKTYALVPKYSVHVSTGAGSFIVHEKVIDRLAFKQEWLHEMGLQLNQVALLDVTGNSMEPQLLNGDTILVDLRKNKVSREGIFCLMVDEEGLICKYCQRMPGGTIKVKSLNKEFQDLDFDFSPTSGKPYPRVIGKVVWVGRMM